MISQARRDDILAKKAKLAELKRQRELQSSQCQLLPAETYLRKLDVSGRHSPEPLNVAVPSVGIPWGYQRTSPDSLLEWLPDETAYMQEFNQSGGPQYTMSGSHISNIEAHDQKRNITTFDHIQNFHVQRHSSKPHGEDLTQLWWKAFLKLYGEDFEKWVSLQKVYTSLSEEESLAQPPSPEEVAQRAATELQAILADNISRLRSSEYSYSNSITSSMSKILEIMEVVRTTVGFNVGAFAWVCICAAIKVHLLLSLHVQQITNIHSRVA
jgi:hypothetical protein